MRLEEYMERDLHLDKVSFKNKMLNGVWRNHVIEKFKYPLLRAIINAGNLLPDKPTRGNCYEPNVLILMDIIDRFFERFYCKGRVELYRAALDLVLAEIEHDGVPLFAFNWFAEEIHKEIANGNWELNNGGCKQEGVWRED